MSGRIRPVRGRVQPGRWVVLLAALATITALAQPLTWSDARAATTLETFEARVSSSADDAEEAANGSVSLTSSDLELVYDAGSNQTLGMRFPSVTIPAGSNVTNAWVQFTVDEVNSVATTLSIRGEAAASSAPFSGAVFDVSGRTETSVAVSWTPTGWNVVGESGTAQRTPNLTNVINAVMDVNGWTSGNPITFIVTGTGERVAEAFDGSSSSAPLLHIEYERNGLSVTDFTANPASPALGTATTYSWSISNPAGGLVTCTLDVDDNGTADYTYANCASATSQSHTFPSAGMRTARLTATNLTDSDQATTAVTVINVAPISETFERRIAASADDAEEAASGSVSRSSSDLELAYDSSNQFVGLRFPSVDVPALANITNAWVQFTADSTGSTATSLTIRGQNSDDAATFGSSFDVSSRPTTSASVGWSPPAWGTVGEAGSAQRTPSLAGVVQQIVNRTGWSSGNAMALIVTGSGTGKRTAESFDGSAAGAPLLHIEYSQKVFVNAFTANPSSPAPGQQVTFNWSVTHAEGKPVSCALDVDGNGSTDYTIANCQSTSTRTHTYPSEGTYTARLTATEGSNVARSSTVVQVIDAQTVIVAAAGDISCDPTSSSFNGGNGTSNSCHMKATSDLVLGMNPDAVLALGDVQYESGTYSQFINSYSLNWGRFKSITRPAVGNHEYKTTNAAGYFQYYGSLAGDPAKGYYSFNVGNWHIISLNTNCSKVGGCSSGSPQETWLRADLAANPAACTLAYMHHPLFSSGAIGNITWSRDFWGALQNAGAEVVLAGHDHNYERFAPQNKDGVADPNGLREFIVGTGGRNHTSIASTQPNSQVRHSGTYGVLKLTLRPTSYSWEFVPEPGKTFTDSGTANCH